MKTHIVVCRPCVDQLFIKNGVAEEEAKHGLVFEGVTCN